MKFRIEKNTVKFRLRPDEIELLSQEKSLTDHLVIDVNNRFNYKISLSEIEDKFEIKFISNGVTLTIPHKKVDNWIDSEKIGISTTLENEKGEEIIVIVEEDLPPRKVKNRK